MKADFRPTSGSPRWLAGLHALNILKMNFLPPLLKTKINLENNHIIWDLLEHAVHILRLKQ